MKYTQDFQDQQIQLLKKQQKKQKPAVSPNRSGNSGQANGPGQNS
jgi:hypothetical protein